MSTTQGVKDAIKLGDTMFSDRTGLLNLWQDIAEQFDPTAADFTRESQMNKDYASDLASSYPLLVRRDLKEHFSAMLRPVGVTYSEMYVEGLKDHEGLAWLQWASGVQHRARSERRAQFDNVMTDQDGDLSLIGNGVSSIKARPDRSGLLVQGWHLRDVVWADDLSGITEHVQRNWSPTLATLVRMFGVDKLSQESRRLWAMPGEQYRRIACRHIVIPTDIYHGETKYKTPFVSILCEVQAQHEIECVGARSMEYVIARWRRLKGCQYGISPAAEVAMPEARLLQSMVLTMLEAGEKGVNPTLLAVEGVIRPDMDTRAGGIIWRARDYDDRTGNPLQPIQTDLSGMPLGFEMQARSENLLRQAFYLDKLQLPMRDGTQMTAYEFARRTEQYIRQVGHLFSPVEVEYTGAVEERIFEVLRDNGAFGPPETWPRSLRGADIRFRFRNPIREAADMGKAEILREGLELAQGAATVDPSAPMVIDIKPALRDALVGKRFPMNWLKTPEVIAAEDEADAEAAQQQEMLAAAASASQSAANLAKVQA